MPLNPRALDAGFFLAFEAALLHRGRTGPNPPVGATLLDREGYVLASGSHFGAGFPHAEVCVFDLARQTGALQHAHTLLVTLEPCSHTGRTPPCTEAILSTPVREVWIGAIDPNPRVQGSGKARLEEHGIKVRQAPSRWSECARALIRGFESRQKRNRPWIWMKRAWTETGSMIPPPSQKTFTSEKSLTLAHQMRRASDAIVTGTGTVLADLPLFTVRKVEDHADRGPRTLWILGSRPLPKNWVRERTREGLEVALLPDLRSLENAFHAHPQVLEILVEAGPALSSALMDASLWDACLDIRAQSGKEDALSWTFREERVPTCLLDWSPDWAP